MPSLREDLTADPQVETPGENSEESFGLPNAPGDSTEYSTVQTGARKGVYVPLSPDGTIDSARFKPGPKSRFEFALKNSNLSAAETAPAFVMDRDSIGLLYDGISMSLQAVGKMLFKWPADLTQHLVYSDEQKEHLKEPTAKVIEKYAPEWLLKHQELVMLAMVFSTETKRMVENAASIYMSEKQAASEDRARTPEIRTHVNYEPAGAGAGEN